MNRANFFAHVKAPLFSKRFSTKQVEGIDLLLDEGEKRSTPLNHLAYIFATAYWETGRTMQPVREIGRGKGHTYGKPAGPYGQVYYGRGYVQLTWLFNYEKAAKKLGIDFVRYPDRVMEPKLAIAILFTGMEEGWFTGKSLKTFIDTIDENDAEDAREFEEGRRIINGTDRKKQIAEMALVFEAALKKAGYGKPSVVVTPAVPIPDLPDQHEDKTMNDVKSQWTSKTIIGVVLTLVSSMGLFGLSFDSETWTVTIKLGELLPTLLTAGIPGGAILSWFGRIVAKKAIA